MNYIYNMGNWILIVGVILAAVMAKFIKEMSDVRALGKMTQQEKVVVFEKRNYYDNHA